MGGGIGGEWREEERVEVRTTERLMDTTREEVKDVRSLW